MPSAVQPKRLPAEVPVRDTKPSPAPPASIILAPVGLLEVAIHLYAAMLPSGAEPEVLAKRAVMHAKALINEVDAQKD